MGSAFLAVAAATTATAATAAATKPIVAAVPAAAAPAAAPPAPLAPPAAVELELEPPCCWAWPAKGKAAKETDRMSEAMEVIFMMRSLSESDRRV